MTKYVVSNAQLQQIETLDIDGLVAFIDACEAACEAVLGVINQPRSEGEAAETIDALIDDYVNCLQLAAIEALRKKRPPNKLDLRNRNHCLANWEIRCDNDSEAVKILAQINNPTEFGPAKMSNGIECAD